MLLVALSTGCRAPAPSVTFAETRPTRAATVTWPPTNTALPTPTASSTPEPTSTPAPPPPTPLPPTPTPVPIPTMAPSVPGTAQHFELVGHTALGSIGWHAGLALHDTCAYVGNRRSQAIGIVDVSDPTQPTPLGEIALSNAAQPVELRTLPDLHLLVAAEFTDARLLTYDVSDCARPRQLGALTLARTPHEFFLWRDADRVLAYVATFEDGPPDLLVIDLTDPADPHEILRWSANKVGLSGLLHSLSVSPDGTRAYLALWDGGFVTGQIDLTGSGVIRGDVGNAGATAFPGAHSAVPLRDPRFVLLTSEQYSCPFGGVAIADVASPRPEIVSQVTIPENRCRDLPDSGGIPAVFTAHNPLVVGDLVFVSWYGAGVQVLDVSDPYTPRRVGQFVPSGHGAAPRSYVGTYPVQTWSYPILRDGLLYVADIQSGLYVLRYTGPGADTVSRVPHAEGNVAVDR